LDILDGFGVLRLSDDDKFRLCSFGYDDDIVGLQNWLLSRGFEFAVCSEEKEENKWSV
jgi:hypothetical protein